MKKRKRAGQRVRRVVAWAVVAVVAVVTFATYREASTDFDAELATARKLDQALSKQMERRHQRVLDAVTPRPRR